MRKRLFGLTVLAAVFLHGCYTVLWTPEKSLPKENVEEYTEDNFYDPTDYEPIIIYYGPPWWWGVPSYIPSSGQPASNPDGTSQVRENDGGRGTPGRPVTAPTPTRNEGGSSGSSSNTSSNSNSSNSGNRSKDDNNNNSTRNNDGGRSTDKGRK